jgi:hypothetical protein
MLFIRFSRLLLLLLFFGIQVEAQTQGQEKQPRILILLDGSSSMLEPWAEGKIRFQAAQKIIMTLMDSVYKVNNQVEFALRVYGHQSPAQDNDCHDTKLEVMFSKDNIAQMGLRLEALHPYGVTPIAYSLQEAAEKDLIDEQRNVYSLILITDGGESCGGNICDVVRKLIEKKINFKPYILSLVDYAPLKEEYKCLGNYLLVDDEKEIKPVVGTIVDAYRSMITMQVIDKKPAAPAVDEPKIIKVAVPIFKAPPIVAEKVPEPIKKEQPIVLSPPVKNHVIKETAPMPRDEITSLTSAPSFRVIPQKYITSAFSKIKVPASHSPKIAADVVATPKTAPVTDVSKSTVKFDVQHEDAKETTLEIYFTDGKGKFYQTTPQIILTDIKTGKQAYKFYRTIDASGNPDPQKFSPGIYDISITKSKITAKGVEIKPNQKNKILIYASKGSLRFRFEDDVDEKEPLTQYAARVKKALEAGPVVKQLCSQVLDYEPGNYHISVNTQPRLERNVDLDFGAEVIIAVPRPGYVQFANAPGLIKLYYELGDQFVSFYEAIPTASAKIELQPGRYKIAYNKHPELSTYTEAFKEFMVKSRETTEVQLD